MLNPNSEDQPVELPITQTLETLGWQHHNGLDEFEDGQSHLGRENKSEVVLKDRLRLAMETLNPKIPPLAIDTAIEELTQHHTNPNIMEANRQIHQMLKDGIKVTVRDPETNTETIQTVNVVNWSQPEQNDLLLVSQFWVSGDLYSRCPNGVGFVNGLPLLLFEFKDITQNLQTDYNDSITDYKGTIPQLFWYNALIFFSNGESSCISNLTTHKRYLAEWKHIDSEDETEVVSLNTLLERVGVSERLLDIIENFTLHNALIDNNTRRIQILENMAQTIYQEWFIHLRFPGHENVKMVDSKLGKIPENWEVKKLGDVSVNHNHKRKSLSKAQRTQMEGLYPYYDPVSILDYVNVYQFDDDYLLLAADGTVETKEGRPILQRPCGKFWVSDHAHVLTGQDSISTNFLYMCLSNVQISPYITGSAQPQITQVNLNQISIIVPSKDILDRFDPIIDDIFRLSQNLTERNQKLVETRDLFISKLILDPLYQRNYINDL